MSDPSPQTELPGAASVETQRFEPLPEQRLHWNAVVDRGSAHGADPETPERWFESLPAAPDQPPDTAPAPAGSYGRGLVAVLLITSLIGAVLGAGGTYFALRASGAFDGRQTAPPGVTSQKVTVESDSSTVVAAVSKVGPAVVQIVANDGAGTTSIGSGIIYDVRGWTLTNKHVVAGAKTITIRLPDDRRVAGTTYGLDTLTDLAIVKIDGVLDLKAAPIGDSSTLQVGQMAIAIGSPLGLGYPNSATEGIVSALGRDISVGGDTPATANDTTNLHGLIQTDAAINPGNSGGPLVDASGRVVGITTASASSASGIGFAIPINTAKPIMQQALAGEKLSRPFIGVTYELIDRGLAADLSLPLNQGAWVHKEDSSGTSLEAVTPGSPGDIAGIKTGDIITSVEGQAIDGSHRLEDLLVQYAPGRTISLQLYRDGSYITVRVTLGTRPDSAG
ncbi:MAG: trypsin-like peptidase domain-containing protein [Candidatus Limnocylindrales bacterium]